MFRMWGKIFKNNKLVKDLVSCNDDYANFSRTKMVFHSIEEICMEFDLSIPIWLDSNINEFKKYDKVRFYNDSFIENIDFDYIEFQVIEE